MHVQIHSLSGSELLVETGDDTLLVEQVTRTEDGGGSTTITITVKDLLHDDTDEEDDEDCRLCEIAEAYERGRAEVQAEEDDEVEYTQGYGPRLGSDVDQAYDKGYADGMYDGQYRLNEVAAQSHDQGLKEGIRIGQDLQAAVSDRPRQPDYGDGLYGVKREGPSGGGVEFFNRR